MASAVAQYDTSGNGATSANETQRKQRTRILAVDDNSEMLEVYRKILGSEDFSRIDRLNALEQSLFAANASSSTMLERDEFEVDLVSDGRSAVERVIESRNERRPYAIAFVDVRMPGGWDGLETVQRLWRIDPEIHIVLCTAYTDYSWEQMRERLQYPDRFVVLRKPFDVAEVRQLAHALRGCWTKRQEDEARLRAAMDRLAGVGLERRAIRNALNVPDSGGPKTLDCVGDVAFVLDRSWHLKYVSHSAEQLFQLSGEQLREQNFWTAMPGSDRTDTYRICHEAVDTNTTQRTVEFCERLNRLVEVAVDPFGDEVYVSLRDLASPTDVDDEMGDEVALDGAPHLDALTGLPNRLAGLHRLQRASDAARLKQSALAVILCDIDRFQEANEISGYAAGDALLAQMGQRLKSLTASDGFAARTSGDEFLIVLEGQDMSHVSARAEEIGHAVAEKLRLSDPPLDVTVSVGITIQSGEVDNAGELLRKALAALAASKKEGGAVVRHYESEGAADRWSKIELRYEIEHALTVDQFELFYQPQVRSSDSRIVGAEALIRWRHPRWGLLTPADFLGVAEESSLITRIDAWVVNRACAQLGEWIRSGVVSSDFAVSVNISAREISQAHFPAMVQESIRRHQIPASRLELEITETTMIHNLEQAVRSFTELKAVGVRIALDDFGVGHSNLDYVRHFPVDTLKIDRTFVRHLETDAQSLLLVDAIIKLGKSLGLSIVAEGVETEAQRAYLADSGCDLVQGYLTGRPLAVDGFERIVRQH